MNIRRLCTLLILIGAAADGIARLPVMAQAPSTNAAPATPTIEDYRKFALTHDGDASRGASLFADQTRLACTKCHTVDGRGGRAGPDLFAAGDKFGRKDLVEAVLQPSASIAVGYSTTIVETKSGLEYTGILKKAGDAGIELMGADGVLVKVPAADIREQRGGSVSLMPEGLQAGLSPQEFADLVEYLAALRQPESMLVGNRGVPKVIPSISRPIEAKPLFAEELTLPRGKAQTGLTAMHQVPGRPDVFLVLHQKGLIWRMEKTAGGGERKEVFADLTGEVFSDRGPNGLLGLAFHPKFRENRKYYLKYQVLEGGRITTVLMERVFPADLRGDSATPPRRVLAIQSVADDHAGGCIQFGPDGYLYLAMGDTGPQQDASGFAQNLGLLLGKVLRLDVDHAEPGKGYAVPADNPFVGRAGVRPEIWAYGFREPWRFSFDRLTGDLWLADVGQDRVEEVDVIHRGENYGWNVFEAFEPFSNKFRREDLTYTPPVFSYRRKYGNSVTGGYVYRGDPNSSFYGVYVCGDYGAKRIFGITLDGGMLKTARRLGSIPQSLVSFGTDEAGNLYAIGYEGRIYRLDFSGSTYDEGRSD